MAQNKFSIVPSEVRFIGYLVGLYTTFIYWGYLQEKLTSTKYSSAISPNNYYEWNYPFALNFLMACGAYAVSSILLRLTNSNIVMDVMVFWKAALACSLASPVGYFSLNFITFPMMILTKSSKPVPVILIGYIFYGVKYAWYKYLAIAFVCFGIALFSSVKKSSSSESGSIDSPSSELISLTIGICLVLVNLVFDGYTNNEQDSLFKQYKLTGMQMMKFINFWQIIFIGIYLIVFWCFQGSQSELSKSFEMMCRLPAVQFDVLSFCIFAAVGQILIFSVMQEFGSLAWVMISVTRKLFTILVSVFAFNHKVNPLQWFGVGCVFTGLILEVVMKYASSSKEKNKLPASENLKPETNRNSNEIQDLKKDL